MIRRLVDWAGPLAAAFVVVRLVVAAANPIANNDVFFHLRLGEELGWPWQWSDIHHWSPFATSDWVPTQPLAELLLAGAEALGGMAAVAWLYGLELVVFAASVYYVTRVRATSLGAGFATALAAVGAADSLSPRPQLLSLTLLVWVLHLWLRTAEDRRPRWVLVPLLWLWSMVHGYWVVGELIGVAAAAGLLASRRVRRREGIRLLTLCAACLGVVALTPLGPRLLLAPLEVNQRTQFIEEWQRTPLDAPHTWLVAAMIGLPIAIVCRRRPLPWAHLAVLGSALVWLVYSERTADVAAVIAAPFVGIAIDALRPSVSRTIARSEVLGLGSVALVALAALAIAVPRTAVREAASLPRGLSPQLTAMPKHTVVFCEDKVGGWLAWRHPNVAVTVDGMFDAYPVAYLRRTFLALEGAPGWERTMSATGAQYALLANGGRLRPLIVSAGWRPVGADAEYTLLRRPPTQ